MYAEKGIGTPKPAGEMPEGQRGVIHPRSVSDASCRLSYIFLHPFLFYPSSHVVLLACRLRGSDTVVGLTSHYTGLTPCAVLYRPFRALFLPLITRCFVTILNMRCKRVLITPLFLFCLYSSLLNMRCKRVLITP